MHIWPATASACYCKPATACYCKPASDALPAAEGGGPVREPAAAACCCLLLPVQEAVEPAREPGWRGWLSFLIPQKLKRQLEMVSEDDGQAGGGAKQEPCTQGQGHGHSRAHVPGHQVGCTEGMLA